MNDFDDDLRRRLTGAADEIGRSDLARTAPAALSRTVRRHRRGVATQAAAATLAVVAAATLGPRLWAEPAPERVPLAAGGESPTPTAVVVTQPAVSPEATASASVSPSPLDPPDETTPPASTPSPTRSATAAPARACAVSPPSAIEAPPAGVHVSLSVSPRRVAPGGTVKLTITARNDGTTPVAYTTSGYEHDFWADSGSATRWLWSVDQAFTQDLRHKTLEPGEEAGTTIDWSLVGCPGPKGEAPEPLPPGTYTAHGFWVADAENGSGWAAPPVSFEIG